MSGLGIFLKSATKSGSTTKLGLAGMNQASSLLMSIYSASGFSLSHRNVLPQQQTSSIFFILYNASKIQGRLALPQRARDSSLCGDRCQFFIPLSFLECSPQLRGGVSEEFIVFGKLFKCSHSSFVVICRVLMDCKGFEIMMFCLSSCFLSLLKGFDQVFMSFSEGFELVFFVLKGKIDFYHFLSETFSAFALSDHNFPPISLRSDFYLAAKKINKFWLWILCCFHLFYNQI